MGHLPPVSTSAENPSVMGPSLPPARSLAARRAGIGGLGQRSPRHLPAFARKQQGQATGCLACSALLLESYSPSRPATALLLQILGEGIKKNSAGGGDGSGHSQTGRL